jgi:two-component system nitrate/nitrite response regulator NarL
MRILLVDDHQLLCVALAEHLERVASRLSHTDISVRPVFTLSDAIEAVSAEEHPDFVFLDLDLDYQNRGIATLRRFQERNNNRVPVAIFTGLSLDGENSLETLRQCINECGATGILLKGTNIDNMFVGLDRILAGELWMPQDVLIAFATNPARKSESFNYHLGLSPREWDLARCLVRGLQDKEIANELKISPHYVRQRLSHIYGKLGVNTRYRAAIALRSFLPESYIPSISFAS